MVSPLKVLSEQLMLDYPERLLKSYVIASFQMPARKIIIIHFIHVSLHFLIWMEVILVVF